MNFEIISSGSKGNCVVIDDMMFDCGVPFSRIKDHLYHIRYLLITHIHSDHIKENTYHSIRKWFPKILTIGNYEVHRAFGVDVIANAGFPVKTNRHTFYPFECFHDVLCYGYTWTIQDQHFIYATDTSSLENAPNLPYDYFFIESNHDERKLDLAMNNDRGGYNPYLSGKRHLSTQQAKTFYYLHRRNRDSKLIELHKSSRFY